MSISIPIIDSIFKIVDKILPDPQAKAQAQLEILRMNQAGEFKEIETDLQLALGQIEINKIEASAPDLFRGGWRPAVGWTCVIGLLYTYLLQPLLSWGSGMASVPVPPKLDLQELMILLGGLLGFGGMRMVERIKGKA
jgi:hypothetical protein